MAKETTICNALQYTAIRDGGSLVGEEEADYIRRRDTRYPEAVGIEHE